MGVGVTGLVEPVEEESVGDVPRGVDPLMNLQSDPWEGWGTWGEGRRPWGSEWRSNVRRIWSFYMSGTPVWVAHGVGPRRMG